MCALNNISDVPAANISHSLLHHHTAAGHSIHSNTSTNNPLNDVMQNVLGVAVHIGDSSNDK